MSLSLALGIVAIVNLALGYALALVVEKHDREACDEEQHAVTANRARTLIADEGPISRHDIPIAAVPVLEPQAPAAAIAVAAMKEAAVNEAVLPAAETCEMQSSPVAATSSGEIHDETRPVVAQPPRQKTQPRTAESGEPRATLVEASELEGAILRWWENDPERTRPICVGQIEIDNLRQLTADFGAAAVSGLARQIERLVLCRLRRDDLVASLGRSRFLVMFPNVGADLAADLLEQLRSEVNDNEFAAEGSTFRATLTCAVAQAAANDSVESLLAQAAGALREASTAGRNRVAVHDGQKLSLLTV